MPWLQLRLHTEQQHADAIGDALTELGAVSVTLKDAEDKPILEPMPGETPLWQHIEMMVLFDASVDADGLLQRWRKHPLAKHSQQEKFELLEDKDWERAWMDRFEPMHFGGKLWVCPSWKPVPDASAVNVMLDPGLAFGTGTHPTTALCLRYLAEHPPLGLRVLDFGCGSGILAIAALKLGAAEVVAVDIDPQAIAATRDNAERNGVNDHRLCVGEPNILQSMPAFDYVLANILMGPLLRLAPEISGFCNNSATLVLSGLLNEQAAEVMAAYEKWFEFEPVAIDDDWCRLSARKNK